MSYHTPAETPSAPALAAERARQIQLEIDAFEMAGKKITEVPRGLSGEKRNPFAMSNTINQKNSAKSRKAHNDGIARARKKPITNSWADTDALAQKARARGGKAGAAAQRGTKKQGLKKHSLEVTA